VPDKSGESFSEVVDAASPLVLSLSAADAGGLVGAEEKAFMDKPCMMGCKARGMKA
jgi:hypothetical protein